MIASTASDPSNTPKARDLVLLGGGHSHALALRMLGMRPIPGVRVTLVSDASYAPYSGMLPGHVAGFYSWEEMHIDLRRLCAFAGATFVEGCVEGLDLARQMVEVAGRPPLRADVVSLNVGSTPSLGGVPGTEEWAIPAKPVPRLLAGWRRVQAAAQAGRAPRLVLVGGGAGGVELAVTMHHQLGGRASLTLVHQGDRLLPGHNRRVRRIFERLLPERGIAVRTGTQVAEVGLDGVRTADGELLPADFVFWVTHAAAPAWIAASGLATTAEGFVRVAPTLQAVDHPWIFAVGDVATLESAPRPKSGVFAVRMAAPLVENLRAWFAGRPLRPYRPQRHVLGLIGTGDGRAVASRRWLAGRSALFWRLKDRIDRRFMAKFEDLPRPPEETAPATPKPGIPAAEIESAALARLQHAARMRCLGCAAKVGGTTLSRVLARLGEEHEHGTGRQDGAALIGLDAPDDAAVFAVAAGLALVQTVDYMPALVSDPYLFGRIATLHGFSDLFAMGAAPHSALAAALVPFAAESVTEETLFQLLSGVLRELGAMGATLLGGHTAEGAVLGLALTANGLVDPARILRKGGLETGQALVLTKPLGTGVLFAAQMRLEAKAAWIETALDSMLLSNGPAAAILRDHGATGCTDITGFGLAGHLLEMLRAADLAARLRLAEVPALPGALDCLGRGLASSLHAANRRAADPLLTDLRLAPSADERLPLLFDPQTSGGLLAGLPAERAAACLAALGEAGYPGAALVGQVTLPEGRGDTRLALE
jgi:selenide, water dikinase